MEIVIDNKSMQRFACDPIDLMANSLLADPNNQISFRWPSLFEYLNLGSLLSNIPVFDQTQPIFQACISTLHTIEDKETLCHIYDRLFAEILSYIKALPEIDPSFLINAIQKQHERAVFPEAEKLFLPTLVSITTALHQKTSDTMHDLVLYLAWDRMCVWMGSLFSNQADDPKFIKGIGVLKECLIESYQHIAQQGRTSPGIYRMVESLLFYSMREENLMKHSETDWKMLSQSFQALKDQNQFADFFYIDDAIVSIENHQEKEATSTCYLQMDSSDLVDIRIALTQYMMNQLKAEIAEWKYVFHPPCAQIVYL